MRCTRNVDDDIIYVGSDNRRVDLFEAIYPAPRGMSYNSYLIIDYKTALMDTVDRSVTDVFLDNVESTLSGRRLDYLVIQHMEPDHSATIFDILLRYPECVVVCNHKTYDMIKAFKNRDVNARIVSDGETLLLGKHTLRFIFAPMVHWPEVMVSYDEATGTLFSADAFGTFGALNGALFADEVDFDRYHIDEARRYYSNIVGKYGAQVKSLLSKTVPLGIKKICPLHGFVWRENIEYYVNKYLLWANYKPEKIGVVIAYASVYGNTENLANVLACRLYERGMECVVHDLSTVDASYVVSDSFKYSHLVLASASYNGGAFVRMEELLYDVASHGLRDRRIALIENGSWAASAAKSMRNILSALKGIEYVFPDITIRSSADNSYEEIIDRLADAIASDLN